MAIPLSVAAGIWKHITAEKGFDRVLEKVKLVSAGKGKCVAEMTVSEEHSNSFGTLHGGCTATVVDAVTTMALATQIEKDRTGVSVDLHITYLKKANIGQQILIEANTNKAGRTLAFLNAVIKNKETGHLIATGFQTKFIG